MSVLRYYESSDGVCSSASEITASSINEGSCRSQHNAAPPLFPIRYLVVSNRRHRTSFCNRWRHYRAHYFKLLNWTVAGRKPEKGIPRHYNRLILLFFRFLFLLFKNNDKSSLLPIIYQFLVCIILTSNFKHTINTALLFVCSAKLTMIWPWPYYGGVLFVLILCISSYLSPPRSIQWRPCLKSWVFFFVNFGIFSARVMSLTFHLFSWSAFVVVWSLRKRIVLITTYRRS